MDGKLGIKHHNNNINRSQQLDSYSANSYIADPQISKPKTPTSRGNRSEKS